MNAPVELLYTDPFGVLLTESIPLKDLWDRILTLRSDGFQIVLGGDDAHMSTIGADACKRGQAMAVAP